MGPLRKRTRQRAARDNLVQRHEISLASTTQNSWKYSRNKKVWKMLSVATCGAGRFRQMSRAKGGALSSTDGELSSYNHACFSDTPKSRMRQPGIISLCDSSHLKNCC